MRRRQVLAGIGAAAGTVAAGCLSLPPGTDSHPFDGTTQRVAVEDASTSDLDLRANAEESLAFWEENSQTFAGFEVDFRLVEDEPDLLIRYADDPAGCEDVEGFDSSRVLGCAPQLGPNSQVPRPVVARVVAAGRPYGSVRVTTQHEIGHVLGLGHEDEPRAVMSNRPEDRIPLYAVRVDIWETVLAVQEGSNATIRLLNHGVAAYTSEEYEVAAAAFAAAESDFASLAGELDAARARTDELEVPDAVETVDFPTVRDRLDHLRERLRLAESLAEALGAAATAAAAGDRAAASDAVSTANDRLAAFNALGTIALSDIAVALGLVRGFDKDDSALELDEDDVAVE